VISIDQVVEFSRHHCSQELKSFVNYDSVVVIPAVIPDALSLMVPTQLNSEISSPSLPYSSFPCLLYFHVQVSALGAPVVEGISRLPGVRHSHRSLSTLRRSSGREIPGQSAQSTSLRQRSEIAAPAPVKSQMTAAPLGQSHSNAQDVSVDHLAALQRIDNSPRSIKVPAHASGARHQLLNSILQLRKHDD
jgi:hypothetical protein